MPARISTAPTTYIVWWTVSKGLIQRCTSGARYLSQFTITCANLSAPNRIGTRVNRSRISQNAWKLESVFNRVADERTDGVVDLSDAVVVVMASLLCIGYYRLR